MEETQSMMWNVKVERNERERERRPQFMLMRLASSC